MVTAAVVKRLQPEHALEAAGYIRVSRKVQAEGHSPDIQREAIKRLARQEGYILSNDMIKEDHERGSKVTRKGYQQIIEAVRDGQIHAVIVYMFDRWGRDGAEWLTRAREFDRLSVPIINVQEGKDEGGLIRFVRAGMAEERSRQLAKRTRPAREKAAREGVHCATTPWGYRLPDEAWIVQELYTRYTAGGWSTATLALWLNADPRCPKPRVRRNRDGEVISADHWTGAAVTRILRNPVYRGAIRYNHEPDGLYDAASPSDEFTVEDKHPALVTPELWQSVQDRLDAARRRSLVNLTHTSGGRPVALGAGLLRCAGCGAAMYSNSIGRANRPAQYVCAGRAEGAPCTTRGYRVDLAHDAVLAAVRLLCGAPWTPQNAQRLLGADTLRAADSANIQRALDRERETLRRYARRIATMAEDPTPEEMAEFNQVRSEFTARIRALEAQLAATSAPLLNVARLRAVHDKLTRTQVADAIDGLRDQGDTQGLRELLVGLIDSARVTERRPESHPVWLRAEVRWVTDVETLLAAGLLQLADPPAAPVISTSTSTQLRRERNRRYRERQRAARQAT
jgi:site-specific DNA recombinase